MNCLALIHSTFPIRAFRLAVVAVVAVCAMQGASGAQRRLVLIDQDGSGPGGSNQMAMMALLQSPRAEVLGITMVTGECVARRGDRAHAAHAGADWTHRCAGGEGRGFSAGAHGGRDAAECAAGRTGGLAGRLGSGSDDAGGYDGWRVEREGGREARTRRGAADARGRTAHEGDRRRRGALSYPAGSCASARSNDLRGGAADEYCAGDSHRSGDLPS